jgi:glycosyltransferase involved in cell wall biosynthesis
MDRYKPGMTLGDLVQLLEEDTIQGKAMSIDRFNLCVGCKGIDAERVGDLKVLDPGIGIEDLLTIGESVRPRGVRVKMSLTSRDMLDALARSKDNRILASPLGATALIESRLDEGEVRYLNLRKRYEVAQVSEGDELQYYLDATPGLDLSIVAYFHDRYGQRMDHDISPSMRRASHRIPDGCKEISFGLRVRGKGKCNLLQLKIGPDVQRLSFFVPKSKALLLTNHYPSYEDLYRNGFVHRRVCEYRENGLPVDVMKFHPNHREEFLEYRGIDVVSGHSDVLETVLATGLYDTLMVHFLDAGMWDRIMPRLGAIKVFIWIHGAEVQPWHRRGFNFADEAERRKAQQQSESRIDLWRRVFSTQSDSLHFIFVSNYFAKEVMEDIGVELDPSRYSIIHNFIDTDLFDYVPKPALQRLRVLSIRPYASKKYANDLSAAAITELSKRPVFQELRFLLIGDGPLFEEIVAPLSRFSNVEVQRRFVPQEEIASIHKEYGIFLTPTRMDSQGVSRDEAMSSGLVPVTNAVTAIPEFVDDSCAILAPGEDHLSLAEGIERLALDPDRFLAMSKRAAARVRKQCGRENTILRELKLVGAPGAGDRGSGTP